MNSQWWADLFSILIFPSGRKNKIDFGQTRRNFGIKYYIRNHCLS